MRTVEDQNPLFEIDYQINEQDYINFSRLLFKEFINQKTKKSYLTSSFVIAMSIFFVIYIFVTKQYDRYLLDFLILLMFVTSIYSILFYKKIFPKSLEKNSKKAYLKTKFYNQNINLKIFEDSLVETIDNNQTKVYFSSVVKLQDDNDLIILTADSKYLITINKNIMSDDLKDFLYHKLKT